MAPTNQDETVWMGLGSSNSPFVAEFSVSSVKLNLILRVVDFCRALCNVSVFQIFKILSALKSDCVLLKQNFMLFALLRFLLSLLLLALQVLGIK
jgi:hypothetical protein